MSAQNHDDLVPMIKDSFTRHRMTRGPGLSWRLGRPDSSVYAFRVTWVPGFVIVTGDIGSAVYSASDMATLWGAVELIDEAGYDYLTGKARERQEFDREATADAIVEHADTLLEEWGDESWWEKIRDAYNWNGSLDISIPRHRKALAMRVREDPELTPDEVYRLFDDYEFTRESYSPGTRWRYEAVKLWAATMLREEPKWHLLWRRWKREWASIKRLRRDGVHFRPEVLRPRSGAWLNGSHTWIRTSDRGGDCFRSIHPLRAFGVDWSRFGLWREGGSRSPADERFAANFDPPGKTA